jgi:DNA polymerase-3 subunit chi
MASGTGTVSAAEAGAVEIEFRTGVRDKLGYAARWLATGYRRGARVRVLGTADELRQLSQQLWLHEKEGFIAHAFCAPAATLAPGMDNTPIWLGEGDLAGDEPPLLLNLGPGLPANPSAYQRVVEIVSTQRDDEQAGRARWSAYKRQGLEPAHRKPHDDAADEA